MIKFNFNEEYLEYVEELPFEFLWNISRKNAYEKTNLTNGKNDLIILSDLKKDIITNGLKDPFFISVSRLNGNIRLESGNNRIFMLKEFKTLPCIVLMSDNVVQHITNGEHFYTYEQMENKILYKFEFSKNSFYPYEQKIWKKPSEVFDILDF